MVQVLLVGEKKEITQKREVSCIVVICIIQALQISNINLSSICADSNLYLSILKDVRDQHLCFKIAFRVAL